MADARKTKETDKLCAICGSVGYLNKLITCSRCMKVSEHIYCMQVLDKNPKLWYCEECYSAADACDAVHNVSKAKNPMKVSGLMPTENSVVDKRQDAQRNKISVLNPYGEQPIFGVQGISVSLTPHTDPTKILPYHCASEACWKGTFEVALRNGCYETYEGFGAFLDKHVSAKVSEFSRYFPRDLELNTLSRRDVWPRAFQLDPPNHEDIGFYFFPNKIKRSKEEYCHLVEKIDLFDFAIRFLIGKVELLIYSSSQLAMDCQRTYGNNYYLWGLFRHIRRRKHYKHNLESSLCSPADSKKNGYCQAIESKAEEVDMEIDMIGGKEVGQINTPIARVDAPPGFQRAVYIPPSQENTPVNAPTGFTSKDYNHSSIERSPINEVNKDVERNDKVSGIDAPPGFTNINYSHSSHAKISPLNCLKTRSQFTKDLPPGFPEASDSKNTVRIQGSNFEKFHPKVILSPTIDVSPGFTSKDYSHSSCIEKFSIKEVNHYVGRNDKVTAIDAPPGFTSRTYSHSSHAKISLLNCMEIRSLVTKDVPPGLSEASDSKDILQGANFKVFHPKIIVSPTFDVPSGFTGKDYSHSSCTERSPIKEVKKDVEPNDKVSDIYAPPGLTSKIYSYSSHTKISPLNCLKTKSLVAKGVPPMFPEAPNSKDILQGANFEEFYPKVKLSPALDVHPGFTSKEYNHSSCTEKSSILLKTKSPLKRNAHPGYLGTPNLNDIVRSLGVNFEAQECDITESTQTVDACRKPHQEVVPTVEELLPKDEVQEDKEVIKPIIHAEDDVPVDSIGRQHIGDLTSRGFVRGTVTREVTKAFRQHYNHPWLSWRWVPMEVKEKAWVYFKQQDLFFWEPDLEHRVRDCFMGSLQIRMKCFFNSARQRAIEQARTKDLNEAKKYPPSWIKQEVWEQLCDIWLQPDWQEKSKKYSENRRKPKDGGIVLHTGGPIKFEAYKKRLAKEKGREPEFLELFDKMHKRKKTGEYCDKKAKMTVERFKAKLSYSQLQPQVEENSRGNNNMEAAAPDLKADWISASGGVKGKQIYGCANRMLFESGDCSNAPTPQQYSFAPTPQQSPPLQVGLPHTLQLTNEQMMQLSNQLLPAMIKLASQLSKPDQDFNPNDDNHP